MNPLPDDIDPQEFCAPVVPDDTFADDVFAIEYKIDLLGFCDHGTAPPIIELDR